MIDFSKIKSKKEVGKCFDYAILPKQTTEQTIRDCCKEAIKYNCKAFCFSSSYCTFYNIFVSCSIIWHTFVAV